MVYTAQNRALACLETIVHLNAGGLPLNRYLIEVKIPDRVWSDARREDAASAPVGWDAEPAGRVSIRLGTEWTHARNSPLLIVPSVIVPEEFNVLINPQHAASRAISASKVRKWLFDPRLKGPSASIRS